MSRKSVNFAPITSVEEEIHDKAQLALERMKELEKEKRKKMKTIRLPNGAIVSSTSKENLKYYQEEYGKL
jgi:hypothetical protein